MTRRLIPMPSFNGVGAGQTATLDLPTTDIYHKLQFTYGTSTAGGANQTNMEAELTQIRVLVNGVVQRRMSFEELIDINTYRGLGFSTGAVEIYLSEPWRRSAGGEDALAWGMGDVDTFQVEIDIAAGATAPTLAPLALKERGNRPMGPIVKWRRHNVAVAATGITNVSTLPKQDAYIALHAFSTVIDDVQVLVDDRTEFDATRAEALEWYDDQGLVPVANVFPIDFSATLRTSDALPMTTANGQRVHDFRLDFNMNTATSFNLVTETLGLRD